MRVRLRITLTGAAPIDREFTLDALKIGRAPSSDLSIPDDRSQTVSWQHARIDTTPEGAWLHDLRSTNGTYLNGRKVEQPERLRRGDSIRFGQAGPILEIVDLDPFYGAMVPATVNLPPTGSNNMQRTEAPPPMAPLRPGAPQVNVPPPAVGRRAPLQGQNKPAAMSATRAMLVGMQKKQRTWVGVSLVCLLIAGSTITYMLVRHEKKIETLEEQVARINKMLDIDTDPGTVDDKEGSIDSSTKDGYSKIAKLDKDVKGGGSAEAVYQRGVLSTAWIITNRGEGTGTVIEHSGKKLIVTAYHVIHQATSPGVILPKFHDGKIMASRTHYLHSGSTSGKDTIPCRVWASDPKLDLAILEPTGLPDFIPAVKIAEESANTASKAHTIGGSPTGAGTLWSYTQSEVRGVGPMSLSYSNGQQVNATVVETANEVTFGDSGGPLFNNRAELLGVTTGGSDGKAAIARFIDRSHVRDLLVRRANDKFNEPSAPKERVDIPQVPVKDPNPPIGKPKNPNKKDTGSPPIKPPPPVSPGHVHILLAIDDTDTKSNGGRGISTDVKANKQHMLDIIENGLPRTAYTIKVLQGYEANSANIQKHYNDLRGRVAANDTLFFYYSGHGACDRNSGGHYLCLQGGGWMGKSDPLHRGKLLQMMRSAGGKLHVCITECCASWGEGLGPGSSAYARGNYLVPLLQHYHGVVDWQAAAPGECGWSMRDGGFFTKHLKACLMSSNFTTWDTLFNEVKRRTVNETGPILVRNQSAQKMRPPQRQQTPYRFPGSDNAQHD